MSKTVLNIQKLIIGDYLLFGNCFLVLDFKSEKDFGQTCFFFKLWEL